MQVTRARQARRLSARICARVYGENPILIALLRLCRYSSHVQVRGSVPVYWKQATNIAVPKPPIVLGPFDSTYSAARYARVYLCVCLNAFTCFVVCTRIYVTFVLLCVCYPLCYVCMHVPKYICMNICNCMYPCQCGCVSL